MRETVVVAGSVAQKPRHGGHAWVFLQYLLGLRRLGFDVLFLDRLPRDPHGARRVGEVMQRFGVAFSLLDGASAVGLARADVLARVRSSVFLLNVMGFVRDEDVLAAAPRRVFLDIDPGFPQMWRELGLHDAFAGHDAFVTIGENVGRADCGIPTCGLAWITTPQPVVLGEWPARSANGRGFTTVASWRGTYGPVVYDGKTYGLRVHEFRKFARLPRRTGRPFELALEIDPADAGDRELLAANGWSLVDPARVAGDPFAYRAYVQGSKAELMVAKNMYVETRSGWVSDRSICFLASGKPVVAQDTGLGGRYPAREGLLTFSTLDEAAAAVEEVERDYERHARAARALAEDRFDSDKVLTRLIDEVA